MAKLFGKNATVDFASANLMSFGKSFSRLNGQPLDKSEVWYNKADLEAYALTDAAYVGQKVFYVDAENGTVTHYGIEVDGTLKELGTTPIGDNKSVVVAEDGTISLNGVTGLDFVKRNEEGEAVTDEEGNEVKVNYQPLMTEAGLIWVIPSATTVEGLATEIEGLKSRASALETTVGDADSGLVKDVADLGTRLTTAEGEIDALQEKDTEIEGSISDINDKIGAVTEGKTVVEMISDAQTAATYDDTVLAGKVATIEGDYLKAADKTELQGKIDAKADSTTVEGLAGKVATIEGDYLKAADKTELQGKIDAKADSTTVEGLAGRVESVEGDIATLKGNDTVEGSVAHTVKEAINAFATEVTDNGTVDKFAELVSYVAEHGGDAADMASAITTLEGEMDTAQADITKAKSDISANATAISEVKTLVGETSVDAQIKAAIAAENLDQYATDDELAALVGRVEVVEGDYLKAADKSELAGLISGNTTKIGEVESAYKAADEAINAILATKAAQADLETAVGRIAALEGVGSEKNFIASVDEAQFNVDDNRNLTLLDIAMSKVTGLSDALDSKVEKVEGSRLLTSDEATKLEKLVLGENGEVSVSGKVSAGNVDGLAEWITARAASLEGLSENNLTDALLEKLNGIEVGAKDNVIEALAINGTNLTVSNKIVNIPIATAEKLGVVMSSTAVNKISVGTDGTMEVNSVNVSKLVQDDGESLILNGGSATV